MHGYRNLILGVLYIVGCVYLAHLGEATHVKDMGPTFVSLGLGVTGVVAGRAVNKFAEAKNGGVQ
jgi:hypothetical protein